MAEIAQLLAGAGVPPSTAAVLERYGELVLQANRRLNLTGAKSPPEIATHLLDSLTVVPYVRESYVDIGSGAGFPAIPVAIATAARPTLIEATGKKARELQAFLEELGLEGIVLAQRAEATGHDPALRERFASGTARAVGSAAAVAELLLPLIAPGGVALLQRTAPGARERTALDDACLMLGGAVEEVVELAGGRQILIVRKRAPTPKRFPRRNGLPQKRPLCE